ncbi:hypothetical protein [Sulfoacidibacillus thermotolerans]|uniref:hypothetical protein n=1 Tax=Sulfoacidibacillus thermotolerans TaxID=1765684 RepID=UPI0015E7F278|nr:hypothetical protein [Sulfoacidibacillus thermotolerans]
MENKTEKCVLCEAETGVEVNTPWFLRKHYIENSGQLCDECYHEIAKNKPWHDLA